MTLASFKKNFPAKTAVPELLTRLLGYQNKNPGCYSGQFELSEGGPESALAWFDGDKDAAAHFVIFAQEGDGALFGFWMYDGRTLDNAPLVVLNSEGGVSLLANNLKDFFSLLAIGGNEFGGDFEEADEPAEGLDHFRKWLKNELNISPAKNPVRALMKVEQNHPSLEKWMADRETAGSSSGVRRKKASTTVPRPPADLTGFVGRPYPDLLASPLATQWGKPRLRKLEGDTYISFPRAGVECNIGRDGELVQIALMAGKYIGEIPFGITFRHSRSTILELLGKPDHSSNREVIAGLVLPRSDRFKKGRLYVATDYSEDDSSTVQVAFFSPGAVK
ncbi:MAG TPA: hypothetical protein VFE47_23305 [Tepidisphaeraceae bacterium]|jgi:hypothetical protein|nr:hypothetical protein [Tepidisphaeraceae bacterium]